MTVLVWDLVGAGVSVKVFVCVRVCGGVMVYEYDRVRVRPGVSEYVRDLVTVRPGVSEIVTERVAVASDEGVSECVSEGHGVGELVSVTLWDTVREGVRVWDRVGVGVWESEGVTVHSCVLHASKPVMAGQGAPPLTGT